jgi:cytochrome c-type biogenesis protein CcmH/NrfF
VRWHSKSEPLRNALLVLALLAPCAVIASASDPAACELDAAGYGEATRMILCDCGCHPQSVHDCACGRAAEMRDEIRKTMLEECLTGEQLVALYVARHGEQIRIAPPASGFNLVAWVGPLLGLTGAALGLLLVLRRWSRRLPSSGGDVPSTEPPAPSSADDPYRERLRAALENLE